MSNMSQKLPTLIDNFPSNTLLEALEALLPQTHQWDIATGFFEMGALLALDGYWQAVKHIRLVMGDETTKRTRRELLAHAVQQTDDSIEAAKERDDFTTLEGLEAVRAALRGGQIRARIYSRAKFHAKAHRLETKGQPVDYAFIGSSNLTEPGLTENVELNLFTTDSSHIKALKKWFERIWSQAESTAPELLRVIERHLRAFTPFEVWTNALHEYFAGREAPLTEWEEKRSVVFPLLSRYQQDGYRQARAIADRWGGAFLCDGVGLGKTYIGAMLLEYHLHRGDRILLIVPKSARKNYNKSQRQPNSLWRDS